jgi:arginine exporter protein ArgO
LRARRPEQSFARTTLIRGVQLAVLSGFGLAEPLLDILGKNPEFFSVRRSTSTQIVLFALAVTILPPLALLTAELLVRVVSHKAADVLHLVFVAGLVGVIALHALTNDSSLSGAGALVLAGGAGVLGGLLYRQAPPVGSFLTVLGPAPLIFLALFLFSSDASKLVFVKHPHVQTQRVRSTTPVVLIVFDEFAPVSLMNGDERIDAQRYPNFAALARDSTWYRSATTVQWLTEQAVPAVLTGILPVEKGSSLPIYADHPRNIFTLLGHGYRVRAVESVTHLCPEKICKEVRGASPAAVSDTTRSLASDAGIVFLHLVLPEPYSERIPAISDSWGDFGQKERREKVEETGNGPIEPCGRNVCRFASLFSRDRRPTLYVLHSLLPHVPYLYLPSARRYGVQAPLLRGIKRNRWYRAWPALQAYQRFLLQVEYTDRALGFLVRRLKEKGIYDRALMIVLADHGVSMRAGEPRRKPTPGNMQDIAFVPLFVKLPHEHTGRIDDGFAETIDVVPTIAHVLGVKIPWHVDGRSLVGRRLARDGTVDIRLGNGTDATAGLSALQALRRQALAQQLATFGSTPSSLYGIGPNQDLVGRPLSALSVEPSSGLRVQLDGRELLDYVDRDSDLLPTRIQGTISGTGGQDLDLAVGVNGRIAAVTRTNQLQGQTYFSAMVPEGTLNNGRNEVAILVVRGSGAGRSFEQLPGSSETTTLVRRRGSEVIRSSTGTSIPVRAGAVRGSVQFVKSSLLRFAGWAAQPDLKHRADSVMVFADGREVFAAPTAQLLPHRLFNQSGLFGFQFDLPRGLLPPKGSNHQVRVFAIRNGVATELPRKAPWPWG